MRHAVADYFTTFQTGFEGKRRFMYCDAKGLVTTGIGNLIDPIGAALALPWVHKSDGTPATADEILQEWQTVKSKPGLSTTVGGAYDQMTQLMLTDEAIAKLVDGKAAQFEQTLRQRYPGYDSWAADAQLGVLSMSWAMGAGFKFPRFDAAVNASPPDWLTAARESHMNDVGNPGLVPRNKADVLLFSNAAASLEHNLDPETLWYPLAAPAQRPPSKLGAALLVAGAVAAAVTGAVYLFGGEPPPRPRRSADVEEGETA